MALGSLYTFGYSTLRDGAALRELLGDQVSTVVDIRLQPVSRKRAFSHYTRQTVEDAGYAYLWLRGLGNADYRRGGIRLENPTAISELVGMLEAGENVAIMCVCRDVTTCHRQAVAELARKQLPGLTVGDL